MTSTNFKELKDGRYRLRLPVDVRDGLVKVLVNQSMMNPPIYELCLLQETIVALQKEEIKLRKSEFFYLFSDKIQAKVSPETQHFIMAWLDLDEVKRKMLGPQVRGFHPTLLKAGFI